jgi:hypothetical protein
MAKLEQSSVEYAEIIGLIADLSRLLGMIPSDSSVPVEDPVTDQSLELSAWLAESRDALLRLSTKLNEVLDLHFQ